MCAGNGVLDDYEATCIKIDSGEKDEEKKKVSFHNVEHRLTDRRRRINVIAPKGAILIRARVSVPPTLRNLFSCNPGVFWVPELQPPVPI